MPFAGFRDPLLLALGVLVLFTLAFLALTVLGRRSWAGLGPRESLLGRLAGAVVLAAIGTPAATTVPFLLLGIFSRSGSAGQEITQTQAIVALLIATGLTVAATARIEVWHRRALGLTPQSEADEWEIESSDPLARRRNP